MFVHVAWCVCGVVCVSGVCVCACLCDVYMVCMACVSACVCLVCVFVWFVWCLCGMYVCLAQCTEVPATHRENHRGTPLGKSTPPRMELGPQDTPKFFSENWSFEAGHAELKLPGELFPETQTGENSLLGRGVGLPDGEQVEVPARLWGVTQGTQKERALWERGKPKEAHNGGFAQGFPALGTQLYLVNHPCVPSSW